VNKFDLAPAKDFGELVYLLKPGNLFRDRLEEAVTYLHEQLDGFTSSDYILPTGDPVAIAMAVMVAAQHNNGSVNLLKFDRMDNRYEPFFIRLRGRNDPTTNSQHEETSSGCQEESTD